MAQVVEIFPYTVSVPFVRRWRERWQHQLNMDKSDVKRRRTLGCLDQYMTPNSQYTGGEALLNKTQAMPRPEVQNWPRVKIRYTSGISYHDIW